MATDFHAQYSNFKLNDELKTLYSNFETEWNTKKPPVKSYEVITIINNDIKKIKEDLNA